MYGLWLIGDFFYVVIIFNYCDIRFLLVYYVFIIIDNVIFKYLNCILFNFYISKILKLYIYN